MHPDDRSANVDLTIADCWAIDERRWDDLGEVFLPNATASLGVPDLHGLEAIVAHIRAALEPLDVSRLLVANHQVAVHGGQATSRCGLQAEHVRRSAVDGRTYLAGGGTTTSSCALPTVGASPTGCSHRSGARATRACCSVPARARADEVEGHLDE